MLTSEDYNECRYMDEGAHLVLSFAQAYTSLSADTSELCRWRVDLKTLPEFQNHFRKSKQPAFISFRLGLEVDSAEVRGTSYALQDGRTTDSYVSGLVMDESGHVHGTVRKLSSRNYDRAIGCSSTPCACRL